MAAERGVGGMLLKLFLPRTRPSVVKEAQMNRHRFGVQPSKHSLQCKYSDDSKERFYFFQTLMSLTNSKLTNTGHDRSRTTDQDFNPHRIDFI